MPHASRRIRSRGRHFRNFTILARADGGRDRGGFIFMKDLHQISLIAAAVALP
ncbi:MAG: hypothetical protein ACRDOI_32325 [Trebonia sp.]